jgi:hypothetical protein
MEFVEQVQLHKRPSEKAPTCHRNGDSRTPLRVQRQPE